MDYCKTPGLKEKASGDRETSSSQTTELCVKKKKKTDAPAPGGGWLLAETDKELARPSKQTQQCYQAWPRLRLQQVVRKNPTQRNKKKKVL